LARSARHALGRPGIFFGRSVQISCLMVGEWASE